MSKDARPLLFIIGLGLIAAAAHSTIAATGGYSAPSAVLTIAIAAGVAAGAFGLVMAAGERRGVLAFSMFVSLVCAESFNVVSAFERVITSREEKAAPLRAAALAHRTALLGVERAQHLIEVVKTSDRVRAAEAAKAKADAAAQMSAADRSCASNCRALLESQVASAISELNAARAEVAANVARGSSDLIEARQHLLLAPMPASVSPLADRLGLAPWALDFIIALLQAIGVNGLGATLLALGAHHRKSSQAEAIVPPRVDARDPVQIAKPVVDLSLTAKPPVVNDERPIANVGEFALTKLDATDTGSVEAAAMHSIYCAWAHDKNLRAMSRSEFEEALVSVCKKAGYSIEQSGPTVIDRWVDSGRMKRMYSRSINYTFLQRWEGAAADERA